MSDSLVSVVVVAPQGAGKTRFAQQLAERFGCTSIVDEWDGRGNVPAGALVLTNVDIASIVDTGANDDSIAAGAGQG